MDATNNSEIEFDFSQWDFPADRIWLHKSIGEIAWKVCSFLPLITFGLYGNYMLIYLIATNRALRSPTNLIVANMAMADLLTLLVCLAMFLINDLSQNFQLGSVGCKLEGFLVIVFLITAVLNLSAVSYDRLTAIVLPQETRLTQRGAKIVIACTWLAGLLLALPLAIYRVYRVRIWRNFTERYCKENPDVMPTYWYVLITVLVWLPLSIMLICYTAIFIKLDRYERRVLSRESPLTVNYKRSVAKTLFIIVIVFAALRLPFTIFVVRREGSYRTESNVDCGMQYFSYFSQYLMFANAAVNPFIYGFNNANFRRAYAQIGCVKRGRVPDSTHHCWYCEFIAPKKQGSGVRGQLDQPISQSTAKTTKRLEPDHVEDSLEPQLHSNGYI